MTSLAQALSTALLHFVWQGIVAGVLLWIALFLLRKSSANSRYAVSCMALTVLAAAPLLTMWWLYSPVPDVKLVAEATAGTVAVDAVVASPAGTSTWISWYASLEAWALPAWALGVLLFALRLAWSCGHASALRRKGATAEPWILSLVEAAAERVGVRRHIRVLMSSIAEVPSVVGWIRPVILLPASAITGLTPQQLESVIAHELAHIRRHDYLVNLLQSLVETLLFYHPVVWWTSSNIRRERELCCDDLAVRCCGDAVCYARALTNLEKLRGWRPGLAMNSARGPLFGRVQRILTGEQGEYGPSRLVCGLGLVAGMICLALNLSWAQERQDGTTRNPTEGLRMILPPPTWSLLEPPQVPVPPLTPVPPVPEIPALAPLAVFPPSAPPAPAAPESFQVLPMPPAPPTPPALPPTAPALPQLVPPAPPVPPAPLLSFWPMSRVWLPIQGGTPWALFRGSREMLNGSAEDQAEARAARAAAGGSDLLWFRLDGKAFVSQDAETMARIESLREPMGQFAEFQRELGERQRAFGEQMRALAEQQANARIEVRDLQADIARIQTSVQQLQSNVSQADLSRIQAEIAQLQRKIALGEAGLNLERSQLARQQVEFSQEQAALAREQERLGRQQAELAQKTQSEMLDLLRDAVNSGKAKPLQ